MANCRTYQELTPKEKRDYIGSLVHSVQSSETLFKMGQRIIEVATQAGAFEGVVINPTPEETPSGDETR